VLKCRAGMLAFALIVLTGSCSKVMEATPGVTRQGTIITIKGDLTDDVATDLARLFDDSVRSLVFTSAGGSEDASIIIAETIMAHPNVVLVVRGHCLSGCAQYAFVAARRKRIEKGAVVGCHHNAIAMGVVPDATYGSAASSELKSVGARARAIYQKLGVPESFAFMCMHNVAPLCYFTTLEGLHALRTVFDVWVPTQSDFDRFSIGGVEGAPATVSDAARVIRTNKMSGVAVGPYLRDIQVAEYSLRNNTLNCNQLL
jgi:hypothetical protein